MVAVLVKPSCVQCAATCHHLDKSGIVYDVFDVTEDERARELALSLGHLQLPIVIFGDQHWSGFRPDLLKRMVDELGPERSRDEPRLLSPQRADDAAKLWDWVDDEAARSLSQRQDELSGHRVVVTFTGGISAGLTGIALQQAAMSVWTRATAILCVATLTLLLLALALAIVVLLWPRVEDPEFGDIAREKELAYGRRLELLRERRDAAAVEAHLVLKAVFVATRWQVAASCAALLSSIAWIVTLGVAR